MVTGWAEIHAFAEKWFADTTSRLNVGSGTGSPEEIEFRILAQVQVVKLRDYVNLAMEAFKRQMSYPGMALLRVVYESAIWMQWCIQEEGHVQDRFRVWKRYTVDEMRKFLEDLSQAIPQAQADRDRIRQVLEECYNDVSPRRFADICTSLFKGTQKKDQNLKENDRQLDKLEKHAYAIYRELCYYAHAHPSIEEHTKPELKQIARAEMPERASYFAAFVVLHLLWPIRAFFQWDNTEILTEFQGFAFVEQEGSNVGGAA